ncbi:hypothetical protein WL526_10125 [Staphylococcus hominis]
MRKLLGSPYLSLILLCGLLIPIYYTNAFGEYTVYPLAVIAVLMVLSSGISVSKTKKERRNIS